jgi:hypothetical protein
MPLLYSKAALIEECTLAARVLRCVEAGDHGGLARALEALTVAFIERTQPPDSAEDRRDFVDRYPATAAPLTRFDRIRGRVVRRGADYWLDPSKRRAPRLLAEAADALRAVLGGEAAAKGEAAAPPSGCPVVLGGPGDKPKIRGAEVGRLNRPRYDVIKALLDVWPERLGKDQLAEKSRHTDAVGILDRLAHHKRHTEWRTVIELAGQRCIGYGIAPR